MMNFPCLRVKDVRAIRNSTGALDFLYWEQQNRSHRMLRAFADPSLAGALREAGGLKSLFLFRLKAPMNRRDE